MAAAWNVVLGVFIIGKKCSSHTRAGSKALGGEGVVKDEQEAAELIEMSNMKK